MRAVRRVRPVWLLLAALTALTMSPRLPDDADLRCKSSIQP